MKKHIYWLLFLITFAVAISSCKKETIDQQLTGKEYFPLKVGSYIIYDVDSINFYDITLTSDTFRYQLKELVDSMYIDDTGTPAYILYRYKRANENSAWKISRVWSAKVNDFRAEKQEENLRFIKLVFPIFKGKSWPGNALLEDSTTIYSKSWQYTYTNVDTTFNFNGTQLDSSLIVSQYDDENLVEKNIEREAYAKNIGLIFKTSWHVSRQNITPNWKPEKGKIVTYRYNSQG